MVVNWRVQNVLIAVLEETWSGGQDLHQASFTAHGIASGALLDNAITFIDST